MKENELTYSMPAWDAYTKATPHLQQLNETIVGKYKSENNDLVKEVTMTEKEVNVLFTSSFCINMFMFVYSIFNPSSTSSLK